jgi:hypothetical protein
MCSNEHSQNFLGDQCADQSWTRGNKSLQLSYESKVPVRVVRGHTLGSRYAPVEGQVVLLFSSPNFINLYFTRA